jgi:hypothetical protein
VGDLAQTRANDRQQSLRAPRSTTDVMRSIWIAGDSLLTQIKSLTNCMDAFLHVCLWVDTSIQHSFHFDWFILDDESLKLVLFIEEASFDPDTFKLVLRHCSFSCRLFQIRFSRRHMLLCKPFNCHSCE